jgi:UDP-N-acetylglucosamine enolpyruvyl transferase
VRKAGCAGPASTSTIAAGTEDLSWRRRWPGETVLENAAREPEVVDLARC